MKAIWLLMEHRASSQSDGYNGFSPLTRSTNVSSIRRWR